MRRPSGVAEDATVRWRCQFGRRGSGPRHRGTGRGHNPQRAVRSSTRRPQAAGRRTAAPAPPATGATLRGAMHGPDLTGPGFLSNWGSQTAAALYEYLRAEMPPGLGGSLPSGTYLNIVAYLLQVNGHAAGPRALTADAPRSSSARPATRRQGARPPRRMRLTRRRRTSPATWTRCRGWARSSTARCPASPRSPTSYSGIRRPRTG